jgi:hypothetical protein
VKTVERRIFSIEPHRRQLPRRQDRMQLADPTIAVDLATQHEARRRLRPGRRRLDDERGQPLISRLEPPRSARAAAPSRDGSA